MLTQTVSALPTVTVISLSSQVRPNGQTRYFLVATTTSVGSTLLATGTVVFRKNGHAIGSAKLKNGTAVLSHQPEGGSEWTVCCQVPGKLAVPFEHVGTVLCRLRLGREAIAPCRCGAIAKPNKLRQYMHFQECLPMYAGHPAG